MLKHLDVWVSLGTKFVEFPFSSHFPPFMFFNRVLNRRLNDKEGKKTQMKCEKEWIAFNAYASSFFQHHHLIKLYTFPFPILRGDWNMSQHFFLLSLLHAVLHQERRTEWKIISEGKQNVERKIVCDDK